MTQGAFHMTKSPIETASGIVQTPGGKIIDVSSGLEPARYNSVSVGIKAKRVMIACDPFWPSIGGLETAVEQLGAALVNSGYEVTVMTPPFPGRNSSTRCGIRIEEIDPGEVKDGIPEWPYAVRRAVMAGRYDACILMQTPFGNIIFSVEGIIPPSGTHLLIQPIINADDYSIWENHSEFKNKLTATLKNATAVVAMTRSGADIQYMRSVSIAPAYVPNAVSLPKPAGDFRKTFAIDRSRFLVLHVANLYWVKNHIGLLDALDDLPVQWQLVMIGNPSGQPECVEAVYNKLAQRPDVLYIPGLSREWVSAAMETADAVVLPSLGEGSPITILEAMAHGKPWLATPDCGAANDHAGGVICPLSDFKKILSGLHQNPDLRKTLGELGRYHWKECYSWDTVVKGWIELIETGWTTKPFLLSEDADLRNKALVQQIWELSDAAHNMAGKPQPSLPLVSVLIPTYNRPEQLVNAIRSVQAQTYENIEMIVVNDCGTDVGNIVESMNEEKNITYCRHAVNSGLAAARNTAIKLSKGKYIAYLDDDDVFYPNHVETLASFLMNSGHKVAYTNAVRAYQIKMDGKYVTTRKELSYTSEFDNDIILLTNLIPVLSVMHEKSCIDDAGPFDESLTTLEDWELWMRMSRKYEFVHIPEATSEVTWRTDGTTMTSSRFPDFLRTQKIIFEKHRDFAIGKPRILAARQKALQEIELRLSRLNNTPFAAPVAPVAQKPDASIIILTRNQLHFTIQCLKSIQQYTSMPHEIIVVDNNSTDDTPTFLRQFSKDNPNVKVIFNNRNRGFAAGNNQGLALAFAKYLVLLNNDTVVTPGWLERMIGVLQRHPKVGMVGPMSNFVAAPQLVPEVSYRNSDELENFARQFASQYAGQTQTVQRLIAFCLAMRREVLEQVGGLDEIFGLGNFEDDDFCVRVWLSGFEALIAKDVFIHHTGNVTLKPEGLLDMEPFLRNWELFKAKWSIPANTTIEEGYVVGEQMRRAAPIYIPLPDLSLDHAADSSGLFWHEIQQAQPGIQPQGH